MFYYSLNGQQQGPVSEDQLRQMVATGTLTPDTLVWREGMAEWQPLASVVTGISSTVQCSVCKQMFPPDQTLAISGKIVCATCKPRFVQGLREGIGAPDQSLYAVALHQRRLILLFGIVLALYLTQAALMAVLPPIAPLFALAAYVTMLVSIVSVYRLAKALGFTAIVYAIAMFLPCIGLLTLLIVVSRATSALKRGGVKVGFLGVSRDDLNRLRAAS